MAGILDLLIQWNPFILTPAAPAAEALHARANIHAHVATTGASPLHFELVADLGTVTHREVVDHVTSVHIVALLDKSFLLLSKHRLLSEIRADHEAVSFLSEGHYCLPDVHLGDFAVKHDLSDD